MDLRLKKCNMGIHQKIQSLDGVHKKTIYRGNCLKEGLRQFAGLREAVAKKREVRALSRNLGQRLILAKKGTFLKKGPENFTTPSISLLSVLHQSKVLLTFRKKGRHSIVERK